MKEEPKTIAEVGYFVEPAKNGGFILFSGEGSGPLRRDQYAFSNAADLVAFITKEHGIRTPAEGAHSMCNGVTSSAGQHQNNIHLGYPQIHRTVPDNERC